MGLTRRTATYALLGVAIGALLASAEGIGRAATAAPHGAAALVRALLALTVAAAAIAYLLTRKDHDA